MPNELVPAVTQTLDDIGRIGRMLAMSRYFEGAGDFNVAVAQMSTKVLAGREMGFGPFASVNGIHIIKGKPAIGANLMAAAVKGHPVYDYRVKTITDKKVDIEFFENGQSLGVSSFSDVDAKNAGTQNMGKFPRNMLFARAMSNGVRWFCPDVFSGNAVYVPEELGQGIDEDTGEIYTIVNDVAVDEQDEEPPANDDDAEWFEMHKLFDKLGMQLYGDLDTWESQQLTWCEKSGVASPDELSIKQLGNAVTWMTNKLQAQAEAEAEETETVTA